jgi:hypothetical protein
MLAACGVAGLSIRVPQVDRLRSSAARDTGNSSGSRRAAGRCGRSRRAYIGRLLEGVSHERARCPRGVPRPERASEGGSPARAIRELRRTRLESPISCGQGLRNVSRLTVLGVIPEIDMWRAAVLMVKRYADHAEANADRHADELETAGDQAGARSGVGSQLRSSS